MYVSDETVTFSVKDIRVGTFSQLPVDHYWLTNYLNLREEDDSVAIPIWYGAVEWIVPVCTDPYDSAHLEVVADDGGSKTDESSEAHDTTEDDMILMPSSPVVDDAYYFGHTVNPFGKIHLLLGEQGVGTYEIVWEYYNGSAWVDLVTAHNLSDGSDAFQADLEDEWCLIEWTRPSDWATISINSVTAYWVRARVSSFTSMSHQPKGSRCKFDDTKDSKWKLAGHEINAITKVRKNNADTSNYTPTLADAEFILHDYFDSGKDVLAVSGEGKVIA